MGKPDPPPEAPLIRLVRLGARMSAQQAADAAGISKARWSQVENGYEKKPDGLYYPVHASDGLLARMADAISLTACRLEAEGMRPDAAAVLREMDRRSAAAESDTGLVPECSYEEEIISTPDIDDASKRQLVRVHRQRGHSQRCGPFPDTEEEETEERKPALRASVGA